jgi:hypothetical protein
MHNPKVDMQFDAATLGIVPSAVFVDDRWQRPRHRSKSMTPPAVRR